VQMHDFIVPDVVTLVAVESEQDAVLLIHEGLDFGSRAAFMMNVVTVAVDFDLDGRIHDALRVCCAPAVPDVLLSRRGHRQEMERDAFPKKILGEAGASGRA